MSDLHAELEREFIDLEQRLGDPDLLADRSAYANAAKRYSELERIVGCIRGRWAAQGDLEAAKEMLTEAAGDDRDMLRNEIEVAEADIDRLDEDLRELLLPKDPNDDKNVIMEIRGAEGGEEANLFARDLFEMYAAYAQGQGWKMDIMGAQESDMGGYSDVTAMLTGNSVWSKLKHEGGVHRVQRVPVTESQGRVHTSSATVTVLPEAEEVDVDIDENDLQVDTYRSSGPGGQSVNTTDSAVRITHKPTGIQVSMQDEKSQIKNRSKAMQVLRARILAAEQEKQQAEQSEARKGQTGGGGRSEKVRTYNFKENRLTDHRIGLTLYKLDKILAGDLADVVDGLVQRERADQLGALNEDPE